MLWSPRSTMTSPLSTLVGSDIFEESNDEESNVGQQSCFCGFSEPRIAISFAVGFLGQCTAEDEGPSQNPFSLVIAQKMTTLPEPRRKRAPVAEYSISHVEYQHPFLAICDERFFRTSH